MILATNRRSKTPASALMRCIFTGSAILTIFSLGMIIVLLFRESFGFFPEYRKSIATYRSSGLEYVDLLNERYDAFMEIDQQLTQLRADWIRYLERQKLSSEHLQEELQKGPLAQLFGEYRATINPVRAYIDRKRLFAIENKNKSWKTGAAISGIKSTLKGDLEQYTILLEALAVETERLFARAEKSTIGMPNVESRIEKLAARNRAHHRGRNLHIQELHFWEGNRPVEQSDAIKSFFRGREWISASVQQNWYGLLPLLTGSLFIATIAIGLAVPIGVGAAIYVNMLAGPKERALLKPAIEFIAALPAVVVGFFGLMVFGAFVQSLSQSDLFAWLPFFEIQERLNAFTAGTLLALMAIPTIFTLTEEALFTVRGEIKEASFAIGATRLQTAFRIVVPSAFPGIISAVLLGFGRVIGETIIVLLCAGNRAQIPDLSEGLPAVFEPVHTMTGMIAQEMGEVLYGDLHFRALFMVGLMLFLLSLVINYAAQSLAERHRQTQAGYRR